MKIYLRKVGEIIKAGFVCAVLSFILLFCIFHMPIQTEQQYFDFKSASIISIGLGTAFRMVHSKRNIV